MIVLHQLRVRKQRGPWRLSVAFRIIAEALREGRPGILKPQQETHVAGAERVVRKGMGVE